MFLFTLIVANGEIHALIKLLDIHVLRQNGHKLIQISLESDSGCQNVCSAPCASVRMKTKCNFLSFQFWGYPDNPI